MTQFTVADIPAQKDRVFLVTGANTGLGFETCKQLAAKGATVVMAFRNPEKSKAAVEEVTKIAEENEGKVETIVMDLSDLQSVKAAADDFKSKNLPLHVLINNAGVMMCPKGFTKDGFETQFGTNHLGHFALTALLFPVMKETAENDETVTPENPSRIVVLSSLAHAWAPKEGILFDNLTWDDNKKPKYTPALAYGQAKYANVVFTKELNDRLKETFGGKIVAFAVHPGFVDTELTRHVEKKYGKIVMKLYKYFKGAINVHDGALTQLFCATSSEPVDKQLGGEYFIPIAKHSDLSPKAPKITKDMQTKLWEISEEMTSEKFTI